MIIIGDRVPELYSAIAKQLSEFHVMIVHAEDLNEERFEQYKEAISQLKDEQRQAASISPVDELPESFKGMVRELTPKYNKYVQENYPVEKENANPATRKKSRYNK